MIDPATRIRAAEENLRAARNRLDEPTKEELCKTAVGKSYYAVFARLCREYADRMVDGIEFPDLHTEHFRRVGHRVFNLKGNVEIPDGLDFLKNVATLRDERERADYDPLFEMDDCIRWATDSIALAETTITAIDGLDGSQLEELHEWMLKRLKK